MATYTVRSGDSWERIAGYFGSQRNFYQLMLANPGITRLHPGQVLRIPHFSSNPNVPNDVAAAMGMATTGQIKAWDQAYPGVRMPSTPPPGWGTGGTGLGVGATALSASSTPPQVAAGNRPGFASTARTTLTAPAYDPSVRGLGTPQGGQTGGRTTAAVGGSRTTGGTRTPLASPAPTGAPFAPRQVLPAPNYGLPGGVNITPRPGGGSQPTGAMQNPLNPQTWLNAGQQFLPNLGNIMYGQTSPPAGAVVSPLGAATGPQYTQSEINSAFSRAQMGSASDADWRVIEQSALTQGFSPQEIAQLRAAVSGPSAGGMPAPGNLFDGVMGAAGAPPAGVPGTYWNTPGPVPMYPQFAAPSGGYGGGGGGGGGGGRGSQMSGLINWRYSG